MSLRFFADHCVSNFIIHTLRESGPEVFKLRDYIPKDSADPIVISKAQELDWNKLYGLGKGYGKGRMLRNMLIA